MNEKSSSLLFTEWMKLEGSSGPSGLIRQGYLEKITQDYYITVYFIAVFYSTLDIERQFQFKACQAQIVCLEFSIWLLTQTSLRTMGGLLGLISFIKGSFLKDRSTHSHYQVVKENWAYLRTCLLRFILHYQLEHTSEDHVGNLQFSLFGLIPGFILVNKKVRQRDTCKSHYIHSVCITYTLFTVWVIKLGISFICRKYLKILVFLSQIISTWKILIQKWGYRNENHFSEQNQSHNLCCVTASTEASWAWLYMKVKMMMKITLCFCVDLLQRLKKKRLLFCACPVKKRNINPAFKHESQDVPRHVLHLTTQLFISPLSTSSKRFIKTVEKFDAPGDEFSAPFIAELRELETERGQRAWDRMGTIFTTGAFFVALASLATCEVGSLFETQFMDYCVEESSRLPYSHIASTCFHVYFIILMHQYFRLVIFPLALLGGWQRKMVTSSVFFASVLVSIDHLTGLIVFRFFSEHCWWYTAFCGNPAYRDSFTSHHRLQASIFIKLNNCCLEKMRPLLPGPRVADLG